MKHCKLNTTKIRQSLVALILFFIVSVDQIKSQSSNEFLLDTTGFYPYTRAATQWVKAGVEGGIPEYREAVNVIKARPGDDLQQLIDKASYQGGVVLLAAGDYPIHKSLYFRNGVVLRGETRNNVRLLIQLKGYFWRVKNQQRMGALLFHGIENAGVENLTVQYNAATFEPNDRDRFDAPWERNVFHIPENRDTALFVEQIWIHQSRNCWVQDCRILWAGSDPIRITLSDHITCRRNYIDRCYNKNDGGMGYYNISNSRHVLVVNDTVKRIRHFAIQNSSKYTVVANNYFEVDINFHDGDAGDNLIIGNTVRIPQWHSWSPIARGVPKQHHPPGKGNILLNNHFEDKSGALLYSQPGIFYEMSESWEGELVKKLPPYP